MLKSFMLAGVTAVVGASSGPLPMPSNQQDPCNLGRLCVFSLSPGNAFITIVINSSSVQKCACDATSQCNVDPSTVCAWDIDWAFSIPGGASTKYNGVCYGPGEFGPDSRQLTGSGCGSAFDFSYEVYQSSADCTGNAVSISAKGSCKATDVDCTQLGGC